MSGHHSSSFTRVYIGRLPRDVTEREVEKLAREFGRVRDIRVLAGFAFVEFSDSRDARDCVRELDNSRYDGERLIAQPARSDSDRRDRDSTALRRGEFSISVQGLPPVLRGRYVLLMFPFLLLILIMSVHSGLYIPPSIARSGAQNSQIDR
ncbi:hypothetical protein BSLG_003458 [Batrachochytrium salamandrivorans]|nr:hypothetical protein BSLG_003458 [Batrachochytrium salamandrivorans]